MLPAWRPRFSVADKLPIACGFRNVDIGKPLPIDLDRWECELNRRTQKSSEYAEHGATAFIGATSLTTRPATEVRMTDALIAQIFRLTLAGLYLAVLLLNALVY